LWGAGHPCHAGTPGHQTQMHARGWSGMAGRAEGWAALRDGLGPGWLLVAAAGVVGFWSVHEPGAPWTTMLSGRPAGFAFLAALATLWSADWCVRYVLEADAVWLRQAFTFGWAVPLLLAVPVAWGRDLLEPSRAVAVAAGHLWLAALLSTSAALLWYHARTPRDAGRRFYLATAVTAAALGVWSLQAGVLGWSGDPSSLLVAWPVAFLLLGGFLLAARLADAEGEPDAAEAPGPAEAAGAGPGDDS